MRAGLKPLSMKIAFETEIRGWAVTWMGQVRGDSARWGKSSLLPASFNFFLSTQPLVRSRERTIKGMNRRISFPRFLAETEGYLDRLRSSSLSALDCRTVRMGEIVG